LKNLFYIFQVTKFYSRSGFKTFLVRCPADLEILLLNNRTYAGELAHNLSSRKRVALLKRAAELNVKITNSRGRVKTEEKKTE
jgi:large subunit ribosomal protein L32e